jgi:hypothetical protein
MYYSPKKSETNYLSNDIVIILKNDYYKIISKTFIKKGTIIMKEIPQYNLFGYDNINPIIEMIYIMLQNNSDINIQNMYPRNIITLLNDKNNPYLINLIKDIKKYPNDKIKKYLLSFDFDTLNKYYLKYLFNAFQMYDSPVLLFNGAMMNHSCNQNIKFYQINNAMYFETLTDINKGHELTYSYLRNAHIKSLDEKINYLINHYNFKCTCTLCNNIII